ncbi:hypothetical protein ACIGB8_17595 [Promicromonospora sukumoe]|uniref:hypothetical protein n=1 Tax=Promicromonospora sukumoe TaxID=88382 RepID=UPI0037C9B409
MKSSPAPADVCDGSYDPMMLFDYNLPIVVVRGSGADVQRLPMNAIDMDNSFALPVTADIQEGDRVERVLPNGRTRTVYITKVDVRESPFPDPQMDHTEAHYSTTPPAPPAAVAAAGPTFHISGTNVQVATGPHAQQTMNVGATAEYLQDLIKGIAELVVLSGAAQGEDAELERVRDEAVAEVADGQPSAGALQRFAEWVSARVKTSAGAAVSGQISAAINAAVGALVQNAEKLAQAIGS